MFIAKSRLKTSQSTDSILNATAFPNVYFLNERINFLKQNENLNRSQTANLTIGDLSQSKNLNNTKIFKESQIDDQESLKADIVNNSKIESPSQKDQIKSQSEALFRMNQLKETQHLSNEQQQKSNNNNINNTFNNSDRINEQQIHIEWEQINFVDDQHDKIIDNLKFQVDSLTIKMESLTEDDVDLANEFVNQLDGFGKMNLVTKINSIFKIL